MRICSKCRQEKPLSEFYKNKKEHGGHSYLCKLCERAYRQNYKRKNWKQISISNGIRNMMKNYGMTPQDYEAMFSQQKGLCAICYNPETAKDRQGNIRPLSIDHNHITKKVRSLLCHRCNVAIGLFKEDIKLLEKAISYLK
jgi:galactose-1-phosphate uridylyltransferase